MKSISHLSVGFAIFLAWSCFGSSASAAFIIDTSSGWRGGGYQPLGEFTFGQTFTTPTDNVLNDFQFSLFQPFDKDPVTVRAYIMAWNGLRADGPILFESSPVTINNISGSPTINYLPYTFSTGGLVLDPGQKYVAFLSGALDYTGSPGEAAMAVNSDTYSGGEYVAIHNQYNFARLTSPTENWGSSNEDAIFLARFDSSPVATPEPRSLVMLATGGIAGLFAGLLRALRTRFASFSR